MRLFAGFALLALAGCGGGGDEAATNEKKARPASLAEGQWELTSEVTAFSVVDGGSPQIDTPVGTRATESVCIGEGRAPTRFFSGEGYRCNADNYYVRNGRLNVTLLCSREGLDGSIPMTTDGRFEEETAEFTREIRTSLSGSGDVQITQNVTARRTGDCPAEGEGGNQSDGAAG